jgi:transcriptional regulator with XRE-family HTH domain
VITVVKLADLRSADELHERDMQDPVYRREYERTRLASDIAAKVIQYRADHHLSQTALGKLVGMSQPNVARLEAGEHLPSLDTLSRLALGLGLDFSVDVKPDRMGLRRSPGRMRATRTPTAASGLAPRRTPASRQPAAPARERENA